MYVLTFKVNFVNIKTGFGYSIFKLLFIFSYSTYIYICVYNLVIACNYTITDFFFNCYCLQLGKDWIFLNI